MIKVFGISNCPSCEMAKKFFTEREIPFEYVNMEENEEEAERVVRSTGMMQAPQVEFADGIFVTGYNPATYEKML